MPSRALGRRRSNAAPRLSIGLPVYNGENYLAESLDALLGQSYEDFELIISDNASTDGTADICRRYGKQHRDPLCPPATQHRPVPDHNFVFQQSRGELFKWAAADDLYARDLLRRCVDALDEHPNVVLAHAWEAAIDETGNVTQSLKYPLATNSPRAPERFRSSCSEAAACSKEAFCSAAASRPEVATPSPQPGPGRQSPHLPAATITASSGQTSCAESPDSAVTTTQTRCRLRDRPPWPFPPDPRLALLPA